ncbi:MAG: hypothetical protein GX102_02290 [Porphyromonadaceae bacterium]|nr:hypothetical protein [Porphyromonadaceae bacterium]
MEENKYIEMQKIGNRRPFSVPENYFEDFTAQMVSLTVESSAPKRSLVRPWMYGAVASLIGVVMLGQVFLSNNKKQELASETYDTYILSQVNENSIIDYYLASETD